MDTPDLTTPHQQGELDQTPKKKKKPNFNKPWKRAAILLGILSGLPFVNLMNLVIFFWAWVAGFLAAKGLSKEFPRMQTSHAAVAGLFTGAIGAIIGCILIAGTSVGGYYLLEDKTAKEGDRHNIWGTYLYPPGQIYLWNDEVHDIIFRPYPEEIRSNWPANFDN